MWEVLAAKGFAGLTLRAVAAQMSVSTGMLMHYFPTKRALVVHALDILEKRTADRPRRSGAAEGLPALRSALLDILPLTADATASNRIWVSSWDLALADPGLATDQAERYTRMRATLRGHLEAALGQGELPADADPEDLATATVAFIHGLVVQALFDPDALPAERQTALVDDFLRSVAR